jgi:hypothetical protein
MLVLITIIVVAHSLLQQQSSPRYAMAARFERSDILTRHGGKVSPAYH